MTSATKMLFHSTNTFPVLGKRNLLLLSTHSRDLSILLTCLLIYTAQEACTYTEVEIDSPGDNYALVTKSKAHVEPTWASRQSRSSEHARYSSSRQEDRKVVEEAVSKILERNSRTRSQALSSAVDPGSHHACILCGQASDRHRNTSGGALASASDQISNNVHGSYHRKYNDHKTLYHDDSGEKELLLTARRLLQEPAGDWQGTYYRAPLPDDMIAQKRLSFDDLKAQLGDMETCVKSMKAGGSSHAAGHIQPREIQPRGVVPSPVQERHEVTRSVFIKFAGKNLTAMDTSLFGGRSSDPYLQIIQDGQVKASTSVMRKSLNPQWERVYVILDPTKKVLLKCYDEDKFTNDDLIGEAESTVGDITKVGNSVVLRKKRKDAGSVHIVGVDFE